LKAQIGADRASTLVHTIVVTAANVAGIAKTAELLHGAEQQVHGDAGYTGVENGRRSWRWRARSTGRSPANAA
jgi:IS5 family transposase